MPQHMNHKGGSLSYCCFSLTHTGLLTALVPLRRLFPPLLLLHRNPPWKPNPSIYCSTSWEVWQCLLWPFTTWGSELRTRHTNTVVFCMPFSSQTQEQWMSQLQKCHQLWSGMQRDLNPTKDASWKILVEHKTQHPVHLRTPESDWKEGGCKPQGECWHGMWHHEKTWGRKEEKVRRRLQHSIQLEISA